MVFKLSSLLDSLPIRVVSRTTQQNLQHCLSNIISCVEFLPLTAKKKFFKKQKKTYINTSGAISKISTFDYIRTVCFKEILPSGLNVKTQNCHEDINVVFLANVKL